MCMQCDRHTITCNKAMYLLRAVVLIKKSPRGGTLGISGWGCAGFFLIFLSSNSWFP